MQSQRGDIKANASAPTFKPSLRSMGTGLLAMTRGARFISSGLLPLLLLLIPLLSANGGPETDADVASDVMRGTSPPPPSIECPVCTTEAGVEAPRPSMTATEAWRSMPGRAGAGSPAVVLLDVAVPARPGIAEWLRCSEGGDGRIAACWRSSALRDEGNWKAKVGRVGAAGSNVSARRDSERGAPARSAIAGSQGALPREEIGEAEAGPPGLRGVACWLLPSTMSEREDVGSIGGRAAKSADEGMTIGARFLLSRMFR